jgi:hypothetical protein
VSFYFSCNMLTVPNRRQLQFTFPILNVLEDDGRCYVLLDVPIESSEMENVYCVSSNGSLLWRVAEWNGPPEGRVYEQGLLENGALRLWGRNGFWVTVDPNTGAIREET